MPRPSFATILLLVALLTGDAGLAAADPAASAPPPTASPSAASAAADAALSALLRTAIVTADLAASKRFYVDGLGFRLRFEGDITRPPVSRQLDLAAGQTAWFVVLQGAASLHGQPVVGAMIGLLNVDHPAPAALARPPGAGLATGEAMLAVETDQFAAVEGRLRALGTPFLVEPMRSPDGRETEMVVRDPAGIRVHVVERRPANQTLSRSPMRSGSR